MANACSIFSFFPVEGNDLTKIKEILSDNVDGSFVEVNAGIIAKTEIFSCKPWHIPAYMESIEDFNHHTFVGGANFTGGSSYFTSSGEMANIIGFVEDDVDSSIDNFNILTEECPKDIIKTLFLEYFEEELAYHEETAKEDFEDEWAAEQVAIFQALISFVEG